MSNAGTIVLEWVSPILGVVIGNAMFLAPFQDVRQAVRRGSLGDLNPLPWAMMLGNCCGWVTYSFLIQNYFVFCGNAPGFIFSVYFNLAASQLSYKEQFASLPQHEDMNERDTDDASIKDKDTNHVDSTFHYSTPRHDYIVVTMVMFWTAIISILIFGTSLTSQTQQNLVGIVANVILLFFYGAPLSTIALILRTHTTASIHVPTMIMNTANGTFWACYGIAIGDYFIYVPNAIGAVLGGIQMILFVIFPRKEKPTESETATVNGDKQSGDMDDAMENGSSKAPATTTRIASGTNSLIMEGP